MPLIKHEFVKPLSKRYGVWMVHKTPFPIFGDGVFILDSQNLSSSISVMVELKLLAS
jgi:hypothetical protein